MPPGYAWQRHVIDTKLIKRLEARGEWEEGDPFPAPEGMDDYVKAQRALAQWFLRQLKRNGALAEENGLISMKNKE